jgi:uncharacterized protein (DUF58 family)
VTAGGRGVSAASLLLLGAGLALGYVELVVLGVAGLLALAIAVVFVASGSEPLVERRVDPARVSPGELAEGFVTVTNNGRRTMPASVAHETVGRDTVALVVPRLRPGQAVTLTHRLPTDRRAVVPVGPLTLRRADPFGLLARHHRDDGQAHLWVHPRVHALRPAPQARRRDQEGLTDASQGGDRVFHALRDYVVGDDLRRVHWKATAHRGTLMVREHIDPAQPDTTVVLDDRSRATTGEWFELAVEVAASVLLASAGRGFPVRLRSVSGALLAPAERDRLALLDALAGVGTTPDAATDGPGLAQAASGAAGRTLVIATGAPDELVLGQAAAAARKADAVIVVSVGPPVATGPVAAPAGVTLLAVHDPGSFVNAWDGLR